MAFQTQQWKLFPYLALSLGFHFAAQNLWNSYHNINAEIEDGNFEGMPELHALSSGLKVIQK